MRILGWMFVICTIAARVGEAQTVRGVVITADSMLLSGVIVTLIDATGAPVARALAGDDGGFTMRAPAAGTYRIEAKRLAFRPTLDRPITLEEGRTLRHVLVMTGAPVQLPGVMVSADRQCATNPDSASEAFSVWEEARKALRASQLTRLLRNYRVDVVTYVRRQAPGEMRWRVTDSATSPGLSLRPFTSRPAEQLAERGYLTRSSQGEVYHAPDEDVLLSESFAATHCLRILPDSAGENVVRLGFSPVPGRRLPDIAGVLSIDRATSELRRLNFTFVNTAVQDIVRSPGGEIAFRRLPDGSWLIEQWAIWLPVAETRNDLPSALPLPPTRGNPRVASPPTTMTTRFGMQTTGGYVTRVTFGPETLWLRPGEPSPPP